MGKELDAGLSSGSGYAGKIANGYGFGGTTGLLQNKVGEDGAVSKTYNKRVAATTALTVMAAAASGAATLAPAAGPGGAVAGTAIGMLATAFQGGFAVADAQKGRAELLRIQREIQGTMGVAAVLGAMAPAALSDPDMQVVAQTLEFCLGQESRKEAKGWANASVIGQPGLVAYKTGRALAKWGSNTKGVARETNSRQIVAVANKDTKAGELARRVIAAVVAKNFDDIMANAVADAMKTG